MSSFRISSLRASILAIHLVALLLSAFGAHAGAFEDAEDACGYAIPIDLNRAEELVGGLGEIIVLRLQVPEPGVLLPGIWEEHRGGDAPFIELLDRNCRAPSANDAAYVESLGGRPAIQVHRPGLYHLRFEVDFRRDSVFSRIGYSLRVPSPRPSLPRGEGATSLPEGGASQPASQLFDDPSASEVEEWEEDDEGRNYAPKPTSQLFDDPSASEVEEWEEDDEGLKSGSSMRCNEDADSGKSFLHVEEPGLLTIEAGDPTLTVFLESGADRKTLGPAEKVRAWVQPGRYSLRWRARQKSATGCANVHFFPACGLPGVDDHGDVPACASGTRLGVVTVGELQQKVGGDVDLFAFELTSSEAVVFQTLGEVDTHLTLLDAAGRTLSVDDDGGAGRNGRIEAKLLPGRYFLRVRGVGRVVGEYVLESSKESF